MRAQAGDTTAVYQILESLPLDSEWQSAATCFPAESGGAREGFSIEVVQAGGRLKRGTPGAWASTMWKAGEVGHRTDMR